MRVPALAAAALLICGAQSVFAMDFSSPGTDTHARNQLNIGIDLVNHHKYADATAHLEIALQQYPDDVDILTYLGFAHRMIANDYLDSGVAAFFMISTIVILAASISEWVGVLSGSKPRVSSEVPFHAIPATGD